MDWSDEPETTSALTPFAPLPGQTAPLPQRLTVQYLFVWMTTTSILLALYMAGPGRPSEQQFTVLVLVNLIRFVASVLYGASLASWYLVAKQRWDKETKFPAQPGHWICLVLSLRELVLLIAGVVALTIGEAFVKNSFGATATALTFIPALAALPAIGGWTLSLFSATLPLGWKIYAGLRIGAEACVLAAILAGMGGFLARDTDGAALFMLYPVLHMAAWGCGLGAFVAAFVMLIIDLSGKRKHDWLHWLGVATALAAPLLGTLLWFGAIAGAISSMPR